MYAADVGSPVCMSARESGRQVKQITVRLVTPLSVPGLRQRAH